MNRLSAATLADVTGADIPTYDRRVPPPIVHLGVGAFARAHLATYADDILRAGEPATMAYGGTSLVTTERPATIAPSPIVIPPNMKAPSPIHTSLPMDTGFQFWKGFIANVVSFGLKSRAYLPNISQLSLKRNRLELNQSVGCSPGLATTFAAIEQYRPTDAILPKPLIE